MKYNIQKDRRWKNEVMTEGTDYKGVSWVDYLGVGGYGNTGWGCVVTSLANIFQQRLGKDFTPKRMNEILKANKGYSFLKKPNITPEWRASFVEWGVVEDLFQCIVTRYQGTMHYRDEKSCYWIARIIKTVGKIQIGHYVNIINHDHHGNYWCFDTLSGEYANYTTDITHITRVKFDV